MVGALVRQSLQKDIPCFRQQREGPVTAGVLGLILFHSGSYLAYRVTDGQGTPVKVDAVPLKAQQFTAAQAVNTACCSRCLFQSDGRLIVLRTAVR